MLLLVSFFSWFFSLLPLVFCKGWLICWFLTILITWRGDPWRISFSFVKPGLCCMLGTCSCSPCAWHPLLSLCAHHLQELLSVAFFSICDCGVCVFLVCLHFCAGISYCLSPHLKQTSKQTNTNGCPALHAGILHGLSVAGQRPCFSHQAKPLGGVRQGSLHPSSPEKSLPNLHPNPWTPASMNEKN